MDSTKLSDAKKKANAKWNKENMITLGCSVKRGEAAAFKVYAAQRGKSSNTVLKEYVIDCITEVGDTSPAAERAAPPAPEPPPAKPVRLRARAPQNFG